MFKSKAPLVLASQSAARRAMLENAGLSFESIAADINEIDITAKLQVENADPAAIAACLAQEKARAVSNKNPEALVIGADQVLECEGKLIDKAANAKKAKEKLRYLKGKTHKLISAVSVVQNSQALWTHTAEAILTMHNFDEEFLALYCGKAGRALTRSVGSYEIESIGAWLFTKVEGDYFTVMGLPLLPLLDYLRHEHR